MMAWGRQICHFLPVELQFLVHNAAFSRPVKSDYQYILITNIFLEGACCKLPVMLLHRILAPL